MRREFGEDDQRMDNDPKDFLKVNKTSRKEADVNIYSPLFSIQVQEH